MSVNKPVQLGLCCMNTSLKKCKPPIYASRRIIVRIIDERGIEEFRLSSKIFMHKTNPKVPDYDYDFAIPLLKSIGQKARDYNHRLTFHPGQFNVLGTPREKA